MLDIFEEQLKLQSLETITGETQVVIIDDDPAFSIMLKDYLIGACDFNAELFDDGEAFLEHYRPDDRRIIILDYYFANKQSMDGLSVLRKIKAINIHATVIMVSVQDNIELAIDTMRNGATDYFLKSNQTVFANVVSSIIKTLRLEKFKLN